jgi:hypothetical protein
VYIINKIVSCKAEDLGKYLEIEVTLPPNRTITLFRKRGVVFYYKTGDYFRPNLTLWAHIIITDISKEYGTISITELIAEPEYTYDGC